MDNIQETEAASLLKKRTAEERDGDDILQAQEPEEEKNQENEEGNDNEGGNDEENIVADDSKIAESEIDPLRVCIQGLDKFTKDKDIVKFCKNQFTPPIEAVAISKKTGKAYAFISFATVEEKQRFEKDGANKKIKNKKIKVRPVKVDHQSLKFEKKIKKIENQSEQSKQKKQAKPEEIEAEMKVPIQEKVCPLWKTPYEEQLKTKRTAMENVLKKISVNSLKTLNQEENHQPILPHWLKERPEGPCVDLTGFIEADSDKTFYYRNKAEFTIGESYHENGKIKVGFNIGNFQKGFMFVESANDCPIVSKQSLELAAILEKYVQNSDLPSYSRVDHTGFWRNFVVRQSDKTKEILVSVVINRQGVVDEKYNTVKEEVSKALVSEFKDSDYKIVSILFQNHSAVSDNIPTDQPFEIVYGDRDYYMDEIMGFKFRVNVSAFLQVNSSQTDKLYGLVKKLAEVDQDSVVLDICCGIGTIGICAASSAKKIVGIEMVERAINDAKYNAELNGLSNTEYHVAKVESIIADVIKPYMGTGKIIGIVDPPRAGLHKDVIKALRTCKGLDKLIYVSCNPEGTMVENVLGLCLPENKRRRAPPFTITQAYGVDLFPQTNHFEGVLFLERLYGRKKE